MITAALIKTLLWFAALAYVSLGAGLVFGPAVYGLTTGWWVAAGAVWAFPLIFYTFLDDTGGEQ